MKNIKRTIYLKQAELNILTQFGTLHHIENNLDLIIQKVPVMEDDTLENEALKSKLGQQVISKLGDSKEALLITLKFRDNIDMLRYQSFCIYCGHILKVSDHYCEKCKDRISVPMTLSDESLKELKDRLMGLFKK